MEGDGEAVSFVAHLLHQVQHGRVALQHHRLVLLAVDVDDLLFFCDGRQRLVDDAQLLQGGGGGVQLSQAAVNQDQIRQRLFLFLQPAVAPPHRLAQGREVVAGERAADDELAVVRLLHPTLLPHHQGSDGFRPLQVRDVETLDALGRYLQIERAF